MKGDSLPASSAPKIPQKSKSFRSKNLSIIKIVVNKAKAQRILNVFASILTKFTAIFICLNRSLDNTSMAINKTKEMFFMKTKFITQAAIIAALYIVLTYITNLFGLANGAIQVRISEALTVLPYFTFSAVPGLFVGCLLSNIVTGCPVIDVVFGSVATLIGAVGTYALKKHKYFAPIPPVVANTVVIPIVLMATSGTEMNFWYFAFTIFIGEAISCGLLGMYLIKVLEKRKNIF